MTAKQKMIFRLTSPINQFLFTLTVAIFVYLITGEFYQELRFLLAYDLAILSYLSVLAVQMSKATAEDTFRLSQQQEPKGISTLFAVLLFSGMGLIALSLLLNNSKQWSPLLTNLHMGLSLLAIFLSWTLVHTFFALYYARLYYDELSAEDSSAYRKGLDFPNQELVDYWDFMYYSFTIAMCYQTSDVSIESVAMRRMTLFHSILSFILVAVVIGLVVNIISNLI
jgi:uncharacterized membrane protein